MLKVLQQKWKKEPMIYLTNLKRKSFQINISTIIKLDIFIYLVELRFVTTTNRLGNFKLIKLLTNETTINEKSNQYFIRFRLNYCL